MLKRDRAKRNGGRDVGPGAPNLEVGLASAVAERQRFFFTA
jgi:hypothetical protein